MATLTAAVQDIIDRARRLADAETPTPTTDFVTDDELNIELTSVYRRMLDLIIESDGSVEALLVSADVVSPYTVPANTYRVYAVDQPGETAGRWSRLDSFNFTNRNDYWSDDYPTWRWTGGKILLQPTTALPSTLRVWYIPYGLPTSPTAGAGVIDVVPSYNGWDDFLAYGLAAYICVKEDRDPSAFLGQYQAAAARIQAAARRMVVLESRTIADVERMPEEIYFADDWTS